MRSAIAFRPIVFWLLTLGLLSGAEQNWKPLQIPASLVAKTVAWQVHWDHNAGLTDTVPSTLTFKIDEKAEAWINGLEWILAFDDRNGEVFPYYVQRVPELPDKMKRNAPLPFARLTDVTVKVSAYTNSFHKLGLVKPEMRQKLLYAFKIEACSSNMLEFYRNNSGQPVDKLRFWIAPVDLDFPVILYMVEGSPYVGKVYFGTRSLEPLYSEFNYITDPGSKTHDQGLKLIKGIKAEGDLFQLKEGHLVAVAR